MTPRGQSQKDARMRREGYDDGYAQRPAKSRAAVYQRAWRDGWNRRVDDRWQEARDEATQAKDAS